MKHLLSVVLLATSATTFAATSLSLDGKSTKRVLLCDSTVTTHPDNEWKRKTEYTYDEWGHRICTLQQSYEDGVWTPQYKTEQTYDQEGKCIDYNSQDLHENPVEERGTPTDSTITVHCKPDAIPLGAPEPGYTYDEQGREICDIYYESPFIFGGWKYKKVEITYDALGRSNRAYYTWKNRAWVGDWKSEYIYDNQGRKVCSNYYDWANGAWFVDSKTEYNYDEQGNMISEIEYGRNIIGWSTTCKTDKKGRRIKIEYKKRGALKLQSETNYYYSTHTISIPDTEDDINSISSGKIQASCQGGTISLKGLNEGDSVNLYTTDGVLFATLNSTDGTASCAAPSGAHVVIAKVGDKSIKISVK